jgi:hypothetical protein
MSQTPSVLVYGDGSDAARAAALWARRFARAHGSKFFFETPASLPIPIVLDLASKQEADYLVCAPRDRAVGSIAVPDVDGELAALMRRAPCPVWVVPPWAADRDTTLASAVVAVDRSAEANAAAHAAAALVRRSRRLARLRLVHGLDVHPDERAAQEPWSELCASMAPDRHPWLERLASELTGDALRVEVIVAPVFAAELIGGVARCCEADFIALGSGWLSEAAEVRASRLVRQLLRSSTCPILSV